MHFLYSFALSILFVLLLPYFIFQALKHGKYFASFKERLGLLPEAISDSSRQTLWIHAVSVGEFNAARPLLERLRQAYPNYRLVVSTTTITGQRLARAEYPHKLDGVFYFPFDWKFAVRRALEQIRPAAVIILETELWPNFLRQCKNRGIVSIIVNGRISPRSFARYSRIRGFISGVLNDVALLIMQSEGDAERARALGAETARLRVCGNLKYDIGVGIQDTGYRIQDSEVRGLSVYRPESGVRSQNAEGRQQERVEAGQNSEQKQILEAEIQASGLRTPDSLQTPDSRLQTSDLNEQFNLASSKYLLVAGSTAPDEEKILLQAFSEVRQVKGLESARLLLAPRHPERFNDVAKLLADCPYTFARRSERVSPANQAGQNADVILLDTIGELSAVYEFATVVFVGGSLVPKGGHNIIEPAAFAKPIVVGSHTENFRQVISDFAQADAIVQVSAGEQDVARAFAQQVIHLLTESEQAEAMGKRALDILLKNRGAADCALAAIQKILLDAKAKQ
jgi:3-deoxy-D-manno-octulosonic-acid transferase